MTQPIPESEDLLSRLADINVAICRGSNSKPHWEAVNIVCKAAEILTHPEFGGIELQDDDTWAVKMRRYRLGSYAIITTSGTTPLEALVAVYDETKGRAIRR